jgi:neutral ceramidase
MRHRVFARPLVLLLVGGILADRCFAAERAMGPTLQAGFARADITPNPGMLNWTRPVAPPYGSVHDPLFVRALVLSDRDTRVAILGWDLLDAREFAVQRVRHAVSQATGIPAPHILVQATHNHSGPKSEMGPSPQLKHEEAASRTAQNGPFYREWADRLVDTCVDIVRQADAAKQPATLGLARAWVGEWLFNRRPIKPDGNVQSMLAPANPYVLGHGLRFGAVDATMTVLSVRKTDGRNLCTLFHLPMHAVAVYGATPALSADWPGRVTDLIRDQLGSEAMFLQGCAGDIVPARRGFAAVEAMSTLIAERAVAADKVTLKLPPSALRVAHRGVALPATEAAAADFGQPTIAAEIMVVSLGSLALVALPGEPLQEISAAIQQRSPFSHTLVLGYANGRGAGYVGLPGGKARGGYEMTHVGAGTDEAGDLLVATALRLLREHAAVDKAR